MIHHDAALNALADALLTLIERDTTPPCDARWVSDDRAEREAVAPQCAPCPIKQDCADVAQRISAVHGIWGGIDFSQDQRNNT